MLMADRAGLAIEHARAYERELSNVEMLQRSLLPERLPERRGHPGRGPLHARWRATWAATGTTRSRSRAAAWAWRWATWWATASAPPSLMGQLRHAMRAYALEGHSPGGVLDRLDQAGARPRRRPDGHAPVPGHGAGPRHGPVRERGPRAAARDQPGRRGALPGERAQPAARRVRQPRRTRETDDRARRPARRSCSTPTGSWRSAASRSTRGSRRCGWRPRRTPATPTSCASGSSQSMLAIHPANDDIAVLALRALPDGAAAAAPRAAVRPDPAGRHAPRPGQLAARRRRVGEVVEVIQMACHEACSNAIEHGY